MIEHTTHPRNEGFYNVHGANIRFFQVLASLGQFLSGVSLAAAIVAIFWKPEMSAPAVAAAVAAGTAVGYFVELSNRRLAFPAIRPWVVTDEFASDPVQHRRHNTITRWARAGLSVVACLSLLFSYVGSIAVGEWLTAAPAAVAPVTDSIALSTSAAVAAAREEFRSDTAVMGERWRNELAAVAAVAAADAAALTAQYARFTRCAGENAYCRNMLEKRNQEIAKVRAIEGEEKGIIERSKGEQLAAELERYRGRVDQLEGERRSDVSAANDVYTAAVATATGEATLSGYLLAVLTLVGQLVFYLMVYLSLQCRAGSGIEGVLLAHPLESKPGLLRELVAGVRFRVEEKARRRFAWFLAPSVPLSRVSYTHENAPAAAVEEHTKVEGESPQLVLARSRLKMYRGRLAAQERKAKKQKTSAGEVKKRTADAVANNAKQVREWAAKVEMLCS